jgi:hypothetical protein
MRRLKVSMAGSHTLWKLGMGRQKVRQKVSMAGLEFKRGSHTLWKLELEDRRSVWLGWDFKGDHILSESWNGKTEGQCSWTEISKGITHHLKVGMGRRKVSVAGLGDYTLSDWSWNAKTEGQCGSNGIPKGITHLLKVGMVRQKVNSVAGLGAQRESHTT